MVKYYRFFTLVVMLICFVVYGFFLAVQVNKSNIQFHKNVHKTAKIYSEIVSLTLTNIDETGSCNIFDTDYYKIDYIEFTIDFVNENFKISEEYYKKIGTGDKQRYYTSYWDCEELQKIQELGDTFLYNNDIVFILLMDVNGYNFIHHKVNSQMVQGNLKDDITGNRRCRIWKQFSVENVKQYYDAAEFMTYERDTGNNYGLTAFPVFVNGQQYGSIVLAYNFEPYYNRIYEAIGNFLLATFVTGMFLLILLPILLKRLEKKNEPSLGVTETVGKR